MKIIKRSGAEAIFDANKIAQAVKKANDSVVEFMLLGPHLGSLKSISPKYGE